MPCYSCSFIGHSLDHPSFWLNITVGSNLPVLCLVSIQPRMVALRKYDGLQNAAIDGAAGQTWLKLPFCAWLLASSLDHTRCSLPTSGTLLRTCAPPEAELLRSECTVKMDYSLRDNSAWCIPWCISQGMFIGSLRKCQTWLFVSL